MQENKIVIKEIEIDLSKLEINFKLNEQQIECLEKITDFLINKTENSFVLQGYAGTGKSSLIKILLKWIDEYFVFYDYCITAPTHRAKIVIESLSNQESKTLHSILNLRPNVSIELLDQRNIVFDNNSKRTPSMPKNLLIIDESSMIQDFLLDLIIEKTIKNNTQVLFIGDSAQLKPVKQNYISKVFSIKNKIELTKVERQKDGNPLLETLFKIRTNEPISYETNLTEDNKGLEFINNSSDFLELAMKDLEYIRNGENYLQSRILAFENARVNLYNKLIRKKLKIEEEFVKGEILMAYSNVGDIVNSCDYVIEDIGKLKNHFLPNGIKILGYETFLKSTDKQSFTSTIILSEENKQSDLNDIAESIEDLRLQAINCKNRQQQVKYWKIYFEVMNSFIFKGDLIHEGRVIKSKSIDYGYSHTVHKSQGGTYENIFVDLKNINSCFDLQQRNQLTYVALSRCKKKAIIFI